MKKRIVTYNAFDVALVPFPFTDRQATKRRPALVLSSVKSFNRPAGHSVMAMITSSAHTPWPLDCPITDMASAGIPAPSIVRFKIFTLDHRLIHGKLGQLSTRDREAVQRNLSELFNLTINL